jgi:hypothetical protein
MPAPVASGWSGCRVGLAPLGKRRIYTAHARSGHPIGQRMATPTTGSRCIRYRPTAAKRVPSSKAEALGPTTQVDIRCRPYVRSSINRTGTANPPADTITTIVGRAPCEAIAVIRAHLVQYPARRAAVADADEPNTTSRRRPDSYPFECCTGPSCDAVIPAAETRCAAVAALR